jgi:hypothetical protein
LDFLRRRDASVETIDLPLPGFLHGRSAGRFPIGNGIADPGGIADLRPEYRKPLGCRSGEKAWD